jgi:transcriptional regulator with GAF, ATPase, and Fis domain
MQVDKYVLEFLERVNRHDSFPERRLARHLAEVLTCLVDVSLVAVMVGDQKKLYNVTEDEYSAFIIACNTIDSGELQNVSDLLDSFGRRQSIRHVSVYDVKFCWDKWKALEQSNCNLSKGARARLCGRETGEQNNGRELFLFIDEDDKPEIWIELYGPCNVLRPVYRQLTEFCSKVVAYLRRGGIELRLQTDKSSLEERDTERAALLPRRLDDRKILFPYVEGAMSHVIELIRGSFHGDSGIDIQDLVKAVPGHRDILPQFMFVINTARKMEDSIPNDIGYVFTYSQLRAIRDYVRSYQDRIVGDLRQAQLQGDDGVLKSLVESNGQLNPERWIDRLQQQIFVTVDKDGVPKEPAYGLGSYVMKIKLMEYVEDVENDPRLGSPLGYPRDVRFIEDQFIHGKYLLMVPTFLNGKVAAVFWMSSNIPIAPDVRLLITSTVRRYEHLISNALLMEWQIIEPMVKEERTKVEQITRWFSDYFGIQLPEDLPASIAHHGLVGSSPLMNAIRSLIELVAPLDEPVLLLGESGTGKELVARAIHRGSPRRDGPFVPVNCGAVSRSLLESELFGHEAGSFTGALRRKLGKFELADNGTIFLDEITEASEEFQIELLRVLEERRIVRVGGTTEIQVDFRVIASTNRDINQALKEKKLRDDIFHRLNVFSLPIPPLRERKEDIPELVKHFITTQCLRSQDQTTGVDDISSFITSGCLERMRAFDWPGNVRELRNCIIRAFHFSGRKLPLSEQVLVSQLSSRRVKPIYSSCKFLSPRQQLILVNAMLDFHAHGTDSTHAPGRKQYQRSFASKLRAQFDIKITRKPRFPGIPQFSVGNREQYEQFLSKVKSQYEYLDPRNAPSFNEEEPSIRKVVFSADLLLGAWQETRTLEEFVKEKKREGITKSKDVTDRIDILTLVLLGFITGANRGS